MLAEVIQIFFIIAGMYDHQNDNRENHQDIQLNQTAIPALFVAVTAAFRFLFGDRRQRHDALIIRSIDDGLLRRCRAAVLRCRDRFPRNGRLLESLLRILIRDGRRRGCQRLIRNLDRGSQAVLRP